MRSEGGGENQGRTDRVIKKVKQEQWTEMGWRPVGLRYLVGVCVCAPLHVCVYAGSGTQWYVGVSVRPHG